MFWLNDYEIEDIANSFIDEDMSSALPIDRAISKAQLKKFWEWGKEVCDIHHSGVCRIDCQKCIKNIKKELGI